MKINNAAKARISNVGRHEPGRKIVKCSTNVTISGIINRSVKRKLVSSLENLRDCLARIYGWGDFHRVFVSDVSYGGYVV